MFNTQISTFIKVCETGSFAKAASELYLSNVSVMKQMNHLEAITGVQLFERGARGVTLTTAGEAFYIDCKSIVHAAEDAVARAKQIAKSEAKLIRIGTSLLYPAKAFLNLWNDIGDSLSSFNIQIVHFDDRDIMNVVSSFGKDIDCIIAATQNSRWKEICQGYKLRDCTICCAVPRKHPLAKKDFLTWEDLEYETLIMAPRGLGPLDSIYKEIEKNHPNITVRSTPTTYDLRVFNQCEESNAILEILEIWSDVHPGLKALPMIDWHETGGYGILYSKYPSKTMESFIRAIDGVLSQKQQ